MSRLGSRCDRRVEPSFEQLEQEPMAHGQDRNMGHAYQMSNGELNFSFVLSEEMERLADMRRYASQVQLRPNFSERCEHAEVQKEPQASHSRLGAKSQEVAGWKGWEWRRTKKSFNRLQNNGVDGSQGPPLTLPRGSRVMQGSAPQPGDAWPAQEDAV